MSGVPRRVSLLGSESLEQGGLAFCAERLDLFLGEGLLSNGLVDTEIAALTVAAATVEVLPIGLLMVPCLHFGHTSDPGGGEGLSLPTADPFDAWAGGGAMCS